MNVVFAHTEVGSTLKSQFKKVLSPSVAHFHKVQMHSLWRNYSNLMLAALSAWRSVHLQMSALFYYPHSKPFSMTLKKASVSRIPKNEIKEVRIILSTYKA
jgi:hypothetical protein